MDDTLLNTESEPLVEPDTIKNVCYEVKHRKNSMEVMDPKDPRAIFRSRVSSSKSFLDSLSVTDKNFDEIAHAIDRLQESTPINDIERKRLIVNSDSLKIDRTINEFDLAVLDAALSLLSAGNRHMTTHMLYFTMAGRYDEDEEGNRKSYPTEKILSEIDKSMFKLISNFCNYTVTRGGQKLVVRGVLLNCTMVSVINGTRVTSAYVSEGVPVLYRIGALSDTISFVPIGQCNVDCNMTQRSIAIISYLQRQVAFWVWNDQGQRRIDYSAVNEDGKFTRPAPPSVTIDYEELYAKMRNIKDDDQSKKATEASKERTMRKRVRTVVAQILDKWVDERIIYKWTRKKRKTEFISFTIHFYPVYDDMWHGNTSLHSAPD